MIKILLVDDEEHVRRLLKINFQRNNFKVIEVDNGEEGIRRALLEKPEIAILNIMLPDIDRYKVCEVLKKELPQIGIIMLTAKAHDMDKIVGLECGADDYIIKPFNPLEVTFRVKVLLKRIKNNTDKKDGNRLIYNPFLLDLYSKILLKNNKEVFVTRKEFLLMKLFLENPGKALSRDELLNQVWGRDFFGDPKIVDVNIRRLRTKIEETASSPKYIETVWGIGYRWKK
ncbi:DNA-binding response regulator [Clostridium polyendosporum]|uniref:Stage 0 sporulation protein A homolog n=1 Tax=Clostridium polyendosporum TaxID=69208 RepID=A0A919S1K3_9CLOT|nr:response regulator transcription factor [Clostridium polyendosporum]GIM29621.1 DNA-binding response regulator [Clostridium polyendosporum]